MNRISKIICSLVLVLMLIMTYSVKAATIKETTTANDDYDTIANGTFVIGITKFDANVIITASRVTTATYNDVMFNYGKEDYSGVNVYYYAQGYWFKFDEQNEATVITNDDPEYAGLSNLAIYYVNNTEKVLEIPYTKEAGEGKELVFKTDNSKLVTLANGSLQVPATVKSIEVYEKDTTTSEEVRVDTLIKENIEDSTFETTTINVDLSDVIESRTSTLLSTYYRQTSANTELTEVDDDVFYVTLGDYEGEENPTSLKIGTTTYNTDPLNMSIGNNSFTHVPVWKIKDGKVLVALPWLSVDALPDKDTNVEIGGQLFFVNVYGTSVSGNAVTLTNALTAISRNGYPTKVEFDGGTNVVDFYYTHGNEALGIVLSVNGTSIDTSEYANDVLFRKSSDNSMGIMSLDVAYHSTYAVFFHYQNAAITESHDYVLNYKLAIPGKGAIDVTLNGHAVPHINLSNVIEEKTNTLLSTYYNQVSSNTELTEVDDDVFYVTLGDYTGEENPTSLKIGTTTYNTDPIKMSIGHNSFTNVPVWKIKDGKVLVALAWLSVDALPDQSTNVEVGGQAFLVTVYNTGVGGNTLTLSDAFAVFGKAGYPTRAEFNAENNTIDFYYTHGTEALGLVLSLNDVELKDASDVLFRKSADNSVGIMNLDGAYNATYVLYFHYQGSAITENHDYVLNYKLAIPGKGVINLNLNGHAVTEIPE